MGGSSSETAGAFRAKVTFMKTWRPDSTPSNRDRLELYALHKQAVSGDAPNTAALNNNNNNNNASMGDKAKLQAWKGKRGMSQDQAMLGYIAEADRQIRVYGTAAVPTSSSTSNPQTPQQQQQQQGDGTTASIDDGETEATTPRGLAAIPLLCAASAESRPAYVRRLLQTAPMQGWWQRQEALCATPATLWALPEMTLLSIATVVEYLSLNNILMFQTSELSVWHSFWWPTHNVLLCLWMMVLLLCNMASSSWQLCSTILWGSQRTGVNLRAVWNDEIRPSVTSIHTLCEPHHPSIAVRLVGLILLPYTFMMETICDGFVGGLTGGSLLAESLVQVCLVCGLSWWYWLIVVPYLGGCMLVVAFWSGFCFALIDIAGV